MHFWLKTLFSFLLISGILYGPAALAFGDWLPLVPCGRSDTEPCTICHLWQLISNVINFLIYDIAVPGGVILIVIAGVIFITSTGNEERIKLAKKIIYNTVLGLVIVFTAWLIIDTLLKSIAADEFWGAWNKFPKCD